MSLASPLIAVVLCMTVHAERAERSGRQYHLGVSEREEELTTSGFTVGLEVEVPNGALNRMYRASTTSSWKQQTAGQMGRTCTITAEAFQPCKELMDYGYPWLVSDEIDNGLPRMRLESEDYEKNTLEIVTGPCTDPAKSVTRIWRLTKFMKDTLKGKPDVLPLAALSAGDDDMQAEISKKAATGLSTETSGLTMKIPNDNTALPEPDSKTPSVLAASNCFQLVGIKPSGQVFIQPPQVNFVMKLEHMPLLATTRAMVDYFGVDGSTYWAKAHECFGKIPAFTGISDKKQKGALYLSLSMLYMVDKCKSDGVTKDCKYKNDLLPKVTLEDLQIGGSTKKGLKALSGYSMSELWDAIKGPNEPKCRFDNVAKIGELNNQAMYDYIFSSAPPGVVNQEAVVMENRNPGKEPAASVKKFYQALDGRMAAPDSVNAQTAERKRLKSVFDGLEKFAWEGDASKLKSWDQCQG